MTETAIIQKSGTATVGIFSKARRLRATPKAVALDLLSRLLVGTTLNEIGPR